MFKTCINQKQPKKLISRILLFLHICNGWDERTEPLAHLFLSTIMLQIRSGFILANYLPVQFSPMKTTNSVFIYFNRTKFSKQHYGIESTPVWLQLWHTLKSETGQNLKMQIQEKFLKANNTSHVHHLTPNQTEHLIEA